MKLLASVLTNSIDQINHLSGRRLRICHQHNLTWSGLELIITEAKRSSSSSFLVGMPSQRNDPSLFRRISTTWPAKAFDVLPEGGQN